MSIAFRLLGTPKVRMGHRWVALPPDRPSGLLIYLAVHQDWVARAEVRNLLWPEAGETAAHNSLRQVLIRARTLPYVRTLEVEPRRLRLNVPTDLEGFSRAVAERDWAGAIRAYTGEFCAGFSLRDTTEYQDWLEREREHHRAAWHQAALKRALELERDGHFEDAAGLLERTLEADPLAEDAMHAWLQAAALSGHRDVALERYGRFCTSLRDEIGLEPLETTQALVASIRRGTLTPSLAPVGRAANAPLRAAAPAWPPRSSPLVGRAREWARLEAAWKAAQIIVITGEAGVGKTRLMLEFAASKGAYRVIDGRPGDANIPFVTFTRYLHRVLEAHPDLRVPDWARAGLAQLIPERGPEATPPAPGERLRLFDDATELALITQGDEVALLGDDVQFFDRSSLELVSHGVTRALEREGGPLHLIATFRRGELPAEFEAILRRFVDAGHVIQMELGPLEPDATRAMVGGIAPGAEPLADALHHYTGGNPGFIAQTLDALLEHGTLERATALGRLPEGFVLPAGPTAAIRRRLERLSPAALQLVRLAAFVPEDFQPDLVTLALDLVPLEQAVLLEELEAASLVCAHRFVGELVAEVVRSTTPSTVRTLLHHRIALALERLGASPERIAAHRLEALGGIP
jgi:DNA-binding SARP family transcriptional activator